MKNKATWNKLPTGPLTGATLIVTRPVGMGVSMIQRIGTLGGKAVNLPGLSLRSVVDAEEAKSTLQKATSLDGVIFVSPAAVRHAYRLLPQLSFSSKTRVAAMGMATANALVRRGVRRVIVSLERQNTEGLLERHEFDSIQNQQWGLIGAPGGRELLAQTLRERGAIVHDIAVYLRVPPRLGHHHAQTVMRAKDPLFIFFSSAETVGYLAQLLPTAAWKRLLNAEAIVSSARLADVVRQQGFERITLARSANAADLITAVLALPLHRHQ